MPAAPLLAIVLVVGLELLLRCVHPDGTIPFALGESEHRSMTHELQAFGAADLSIVGSSRARVAVLVPKLKRLLAKAGHAWDVRNYSVAGAHAEEVEVVVRRVLEADPAPRVMLYAMTPRQLASKPRVPSDKVRYLWRLRDWWHALHEHGLEANRVLPDALRNELRDASHLFRLRPEVFKALRAPTPRKVKSRLKRMVRGRVRPPPSPARGGLSPRNRGGGRSRSGKVTRRAMERYLGSRYTESAWPWTYQYHCLERIAQRCREANVLLVVAELPTHPMLRRHMPANTYPGFSRALEVLEINHAVSVIPLSELGAPFQPQDFIEGSHVNYRGASRYTKQLAARLGDMFDP